MSDPTPRFYFPVAPNEYSQSFMNELVRSFALFQQQLSNPGKVTADSINLKPSGGGGIKQYSNNREAYDAGLLPGDIWMLSTGEIRIVVSPDIDVPVTMPFPNEATGRVGRVVTFDASAEIGQIINPFRGYVGQVTTNVSYSISGVEVFGELADVADITFPNLNSSFELVGIEGTFAEPDVLIDADNSAVPTGIVGTGEAGTSGVEGQATAEPVLPFTATHVGTVTVIDDIPVALSGLSGNGNTGTVTVVV